MKLTISNIAWEEVETDAVLDALSDTPCRGVEVAPTKFWPGWVGASVAAARERAERFHQRGFCISSMQSLLFEKPELEVFGETQGALLDHLRAVAALGEAMRAGPMVFGSPRNRDPKGLSAAEAMDLATEFFRKAGAIAAEHAVQLCVEPNPRVYGCHFVTSWREAAELVDRVGHPGFGLHLDTACIALADDDVVEAFEACAGRIAHIHISEPQLGDVGAPQLDHVAFGAALRRIGYDNWLSIEMRRTSTPVDSIRKAVDMVSRCYLT